MQVGASFISKVRVSTSQTFCGFYASYSQ